MDYQPLSFPQLRADLAFLLTKMKNPIVGWHDPNFGVRFDDYMEAVEQAVPRGTMRHIAESSLSLLSEPHLKRLRANNFQAILPGIESWYDLGNKSKTRRTGMDKVKQVSDHVNMILRYIPYIQTNFVMGLDGDMGPEPFELTKKFIDLSPGAFPAYSLLSAFGRAAPLNLEYQRAGRVLPFPFHFLNNNHAMNVRPKNYSWPEFYDHLVDVTRYSFSWKAIGRRIGATQTMIPKWMNVVRAVSTEGFGRIKYQTEMRRRLDTDRELRAFFERETDEIPTFYLDRIRQDLGPLYEHPAGRARWSTIPTRTSIPPARAPERADPGALAHGSVTLSAAKGPYSIWPPSLRSGDMVSRRVRPAKIRSPGPRRGFGLVAPGCRRGTRSAPRSSGARRRAARARSGARAAAGGRWRWRAARCPAGGRDRGMRTGAEVWPHEWCFPCLRLLVRLPPRSCARSADGQGQGRAADAACWASSRGAIFGVLRRRSQVVRQRSAKPPPPVRIWAAPLRATTTYGPP